MSFGTKSTAFLIAALSMSTLARACPDLSGFYSKCQALPQSGTLAEVGKDLRIEQHNRGGDIHIHFATAEGGGWSEALGGGAPYVADGRSRRAAMPTTEFVELLYSAKCVGDKVEISVRQRQGRKGRDVAARWSSTYQKSGTQLVVTQQYKNLQNPQGSYEHSQICEPKPVTQ